MALWAFGLLLFGPMGPLGPWSQGALGPRERPVILAGQDAGALGQARAFWLVLKYGQKGQKWHNKHKGGKERSGQKGRKTCKGYR